MTSLFFRPVAAIVLSVVLGATSLVAVSAQEISESHMSAARKAITATKATNTFDSILIGASARLKNTLTANSPDQADRISTVVDEQAIALAPRRGDLEGEAARLFANTFTESELTDIANFFGSPVGEKYLDSTPILVRELDKAARIWANGIARDLGQSVNKALAAPAN
ncbi:DUF2059 domain-containing protein [Ahrensia sp. R2A130]|uniref:DUF2059 domain-containing protein n=1 Tax=Ahrensia sp. R2A130 TaxID=744979 RepID=UPI0001E0F06C|nr:DUF2059 domain-containing protein [Ahrensia sp. R2A130]EFL90422.1 conserved hypothetical protein [Ahrensia sp. R2A130]